MTRPTQPTQTTYDIDAIQQAMTEDRLRGIDPFARGALLTDAQIQEIQAKLTEDFRDDPFTLEDVFGPDHGLFA